MAEGAGTPPGGHPATVGRYRILECLASDSVDEVYRAFDPMIERQVVVKVFHVRLADPRAEAGIKDTFYREMRRTGLLMHHGIAALFDAGEQSGSLFLASEFVHGESVDRRIARRPDWDFPTRIGIVTQMLDALDYASEAGVPHLNLKPGNVVIGADEAVKVGGFGVGAVIAALSAGAQVERPLDARYAAPEMVRGDAGDARADVFSAGRVAIDVLLSGAESPAGHASAGGRAQDHAAPAISQWLLDRGVNSVRWKVVFDRALAREPADRFDTPGEFRRALREALGLSEGHRWYHEHNRASAEPDVEPEWETGLTPSGLRSSSVDDLLKELAAADGESDIDAEIAKIEEEDATIEGRPAKPAS